MSLLLLLPRKIAWWRGPWTPVLGTMQADEKLLRAVTLESDGYNAVPNGTMETGDPPTGWTANADGTIDAAADERTGGAGAQSLEMTTTAADPGQVYVYQDITVIPGATYIGAAWVRKVGAGTYSIYAGSTGANWGGTVSETWTEKTKTGIVPASDALQLAGFLQAGSQGHTGRYDDVQIYLTPSMHYQSRWTRSDVTIVADVVMPASAVTPRGIAVRIDDATNYVLVEIRPNTAGDDLFIVEVVNGARTQKAAADVDWTANGTDQIRVTASDTVFRVDTKKSGASDWTLNVVRWQRADVAPSSHHGVMFFTAGEDSISDIEYASPINVECPVFFGDSITSGTGASDADHRWVNIIAAARGWTAFRNGGIGGTMLQNTTSAANNGRDTYATRVLTYSPTHVFILYGTNDVEGNISGGATLTAANYENDLGEIVDGLVANGVDVDHIIIGSPPWSTSTDYRAQLPDYGVACAAVATAKGCRYIDVYAAMQTGGGDTLMDDSVHPNDAGHAVIAAAFLSVL